MKLCRSLGFLLFGVLPLAAQSHTGHRAPEASSKVPLALARVRSRVLDTYGKLPLAFETNQGQADPEVKFLSRGAGYNLFLTPTESVLTLSDVSRHESKLQPGKALPAQEERTTVLRMKLLGANPKTMVRGQDELPGKSNYFLGNDPKQWHAGVPQYGRVRYPDVYPGVDLVYYGNQREIEYDFVLQPRADPNAIQMGIEGASRIRLVRGDVVVSSAKGDVHLRTPQIYQEANGARHAVLGHYVIQGKNKVGFHVGSYDRRRALVIDPVLAYSTYLGGTGDDSAFGIAVDSAGSVYVTGGTSSIDFPTLHPIQPTNHGGYLGDVFVTKLNADGSALVYSTYLGGSGLDTGINIAVDSAGNAYVTGLTESPDFPTAHPIQTILKGDTDAFVAKLNPAGSALVYSTYLGGTQNDGVGGIALDSAGNVYVAGITYSTDFPTANPLQPNAGGNNNNGDAFVTKINPAGRAFVYSTYLGGSGYDGATNISVDSEGNAYVAGLAESPDFPTVKALQPNYGGNRDAFATKINAAGTTLVYSTYLGGSGLDSGFGAVDQEGNFYVSGLTTSTNFPTANAFQPTYGGGYSDGFIAKINAAGSDFVYSTYFGGSGEDSTGGIAVDAAGNAYVTGLTASTDFPLANAIQPAKHGRYDAFVSEINAVGSALVYSTYLGSTKNDFGTRIAVDSVGGTYVTGRTSWKNFPTTALAFQPGFNGSLDAFVTKIASATVVNLAPLKLLLGSHPVGTTKTKQEALTNNGTQALVLNKIYIAGANASDFSETNNCGAVLAAGATCSIQVTFKPTAIGPRKAILAISDSDPASPQALPLSGTGK